MVRASYLFATDHNIVSSTAVHIAGVAQLPCPIPRILLMLFVMYSLTEMPCPVFTLNVVLTSTFASMCTVVLGIPNCLQHSIADGRIILL